MSGGGFGEAGVIFADDDVDVLVDLFDFEVAFVVGMVFGVHGGSVELSGIGESLGQTHGPVPRRRAEVNDVPRVAVSEGMDDGVFVVEMVYVRLHCPAL